MSENKDDTAHIDFNGVISQSQVKGCYTECKSSFEKEKCVDFIWMNVYINAFAQFRMGVSKINNHRHPFPLTTRNKTCPFCTEEIETEVHFLLQCTRGDAR